VCHILEHKRRQKWAKTSSRLINEAKLEVGVVVRLESFARLRGSFTEMISRVRDSVADNRKLAASSEFLAACDELGELSRFLKAFGITNVCFDPLVVYNAWIGGFMFQLLVENTTKGIDVIAAGGSYDSLVQRFQRSNNDTSAVGVHFAIEVLIEIEKQHDRNAAATAAAAATASPPTLLAQRIDTPEVMVCSEAQEFLEHRMQLASELWARQVRVDYLQPVMSSHEALAYATTAGIKVVVMLRNSSRSSNIVLVKVVQIEGHVELELDFASTAKVVHALLQANRIRELQAQLDALQPVQNLLATYSLAPGALAAAAKRRGTSGNYAAVASSATMSAGATAASGVPPSSSSNYSALTAALAQAAGGGGSSSSSSNSSNNVAMAAAGGTGSGAPSTALGGNAAALTAGAASGATPSHAIVPPTSLVFLSTPTPKLKKKITDDVVRGLTPVLRYCASGDVKVIVLELAHSVIRELLGCFDGTAFKLKPKLVSRHREQVDRFRDYMKIHHNLPLVVLYSTVDQRFEILLLSRAFVM